MSPISTTPATVTAPDQRGYLALDAAALVQVQRLLAQADHAALGWSDPDTGLPGISRISFGLDPQLGPMTLISALAEHSRALRKSAACAVMLGAVAARGDPLSQPRLMLRATAEFLPGPAGDHPQIAARWLARQPKAKLYLGLGDFSFLRLRLTAGLFNGGFCRAYALPDTLLATLGNAAEPGAETPL